MEWGPIILSFRLAVITTIVLLIISIPLARWLAFTNTKIKPLVETLVSMPLVLPPTVLGFYLLVAFSPTFLVGRVIDEYLGIRLAFSFEGLVLASVIYSLPFMVHPIQSGFSHLPSSMMEASRILGKSNAVTLFRIMLPNIKRSLVTGIILTFAHTIGEFGVVLMIGGNIPGRTRVASIAIYDEVEALNYPQAHQYSILLFTITFIILFGVFISNRGGIKSMFR
jgi:molybdate transport system permease protein